MRKQSSRIAFHIKALWAYQRYPLTPMYKRYSEHMELEQASEYGVLDPVDIQAVVTKLYGVYAAGDVYERYREHALQCGRIPAHKTRVGQWLVRQGYPRRKSRGKTLYMFWA